MSQPVSRSRKQFSSRSNSAFAQESPELGPMLQNALDSLDVNLDEELARYRRHVLVQQRTARQQPTDLSSHALSPFSLDDLADIDPPNLLPGAESSYTDSSESEPSVATAAFEPDASAVNDVNHDPGVTATSGSSSLVTIQAPDHPTDPSALSSPSDSTDSLTTPLPSNPDDYLESSEELLRSLEDEEQRAAAIAAEATAPKQSLVDSLFTPLGVGSILLLILSSATLGYLVIRPSTLNMLAFWLKDQSTALSGQHSQSEAGLSNLSPDLASGEFDPLRASNLSSLPAVVDTDALREGDVDGSANESDAEGSTASGSNANSGTSAAPDANASNNGAESSHTTSPATIVPPARVIAPSIATSLPTVPVQIAPPRPAPAPRYNPPAPRSNRPPAPTQSPPAQRRSAPAPTPIAPAPSPVPVSPAPAVPPAPAAATSPSPSPAPSITPAPDPSAPPVASIDEPVVEPTSEPTSESTSESIPIEVIAPPVSPTKPTAVAPPAPAPAAAPPPPTQSPSAAPVREDLYYVTTPYTGDQSLESARDAVSGSYVRNFPEGTQVQMGAFSNETGAESMIQNLESQGIPAEIYKED